GGSNSYTNDASLLIPKNAMTGNYRAIARHHWAGYSGFYAVTAVEDNTSVTLAKGPQGGQVKAGIPGIDATGAGSVTLNRGDVIQLLTNGGTSNSDPNDVTGALITASKPVQVIGGHNCTFVPDNTGYCDHLEESMFPIETIAKDYIVTSPLIAVNTPKANMVRIVAIDPNVQLTYDPPQAGAPTTIASAGGWVEFQSGASFQISGTGRFQVAQYMLGQGAGGGSGDPAMALTVPPFQYRRDYLFHAPTNYSSNFAAIIAPVGASVTLDGAAVTGFATIGGTGYAVKHVLLSNAGNGNHTLVSDTAIGVTVYGYGQYTSYWYPGGLDLRNFN
ncbi:MAG: IgGFc-binding protein, partial [Dehalococcoidia bacterium]|nr:IgGFc-binding protein [Dehalococcoidia bacterium]